MLSWLSMVSLSEFLLLLLSAVLQYDLIYTGDLGYFIGNRITSTSKRITLKLKHRDGGHLAVTGDQLL